MPSGTVFLLHGGQSVGVVPLQSLGTNPYHHLAAEWKMRAHTRTHRGSYALITKPHSHGDRASERDMDYYRSRVLHFPSTCVTWLKQGRQGHTDAALTSESVMELMELMTHHQTGQRQIWYAVLLNHSFSTSKSNLSHLSFKMHWWLLHSSQVQVYWPSRLFRLYISYQWYNKQHWCKWSHKRPFQDYKLEIYRTSISFVITN